MVPVDGLLCLRCGYNVYALPASRCPECGQPIDWDEVRLAYHRRKKTLFEYHWRRRPLGSLLATWLRIGRPGTLWRHIDIHDAPQVRPLMVMVGIALAASAALLVVCWGVANWVLDWFWATPPTSPGTAIGLSLTRLGQWVLRSPSDPTVHTGWLLGLLWCLASLAALLVFRQSMRRYQVRTVHVLRMWAYAVVLPLPLFPLAICIWSYFGGRFDLYGFVYYAVGIVLVYVCYSVSRGYRLYLRMDHGPSFAVASQVIAVLSSVALTNLIVPGGVSWQMLADLLKVLRLP